MLLIFLQLFDLRLWRLTELEPPFYWLDIFRSAFVQLAQKVAHQSDS